MQTSFENFGSTLHFKIKDYSDLQAILKLDEALWVATTAPLSTLRIDPVFLNLLDSDGDGRLRAEEIKDGIRFLQNNLVDYSGVRENNLNLSLVAINTETDLGKRIHSSALKVLSRLNITAESVKLNQIRTVKKEVLEGGLDQAGIVLAEAAETSKSHDYLKDIIRTVSFSYQETDPVFSSLRYQATQPTTPHRCS